MTQDSFPDRGPDREEPAATPRPAPAPPGCGRPAARCDLDHAIAWDQGGLTCECGLAPLCRHHHRCKQGRAGNLNNQAQAS